MPESAEEVYARVSAAGGRLPTPPITEWPTFPWEVEDGALVAKRLASPEAEQPREGEGDRPCPVCKPPTGVIWEDETWRVKTHPRGQSGLPLVLLLEAHEHIDYHELDDDQAADLGRISVRLARIVESLPEIARCHVHRFGDGCSHVHVWFTARTAGLLSTRGSYAMEWDEIIPPGPEDVWKADLAAVARKLATHRGRALV